MGWVSAVRVYWRGYGTCGHVMNFSRVYCYGGLQAQSLCEASIHGSAVQGIQLDLNSKNSFGLLLHSCLSWFTTETTGPTF